MEAVKSVLESVHRYFVQNGDFNKRSAQLKRVVGITRSSTVDFISDEVFYEIKENGLVLVHYIKEGVVKMGNSINQSEFERRKKALLDRILDDSRKDLTFKKTNLTTYQKKQVQKAFGHGIQPVRKRQYFGIKIGWFND
ncbi:hypothetical protein [Rossellomorea aquimaris]|uniref:hypothetical protein n=1 Tax=Rossellomorea aquimaris TaxID=189382 RepID=UPI0005C8AA03|nr:hypothetical protein [Rossellomorea aquimaris]